MNHQLGRVGVAVVVGATLLTFGCAGSSPSPSPLSSTQPAASASAARSGPQAGWSFESGLSGWTLESGATQPACDVVLADRLRTREGKPPVTLSPSGDYWRTPIDVGAEGRCRIDTELAPRRKTRLAC